MYSVKSISNVLGVSTSAVYKKIRKFKTDLEPHIKEINGSKTLSNTGVKTLASKYDEFKKNKLLSLLVVNQEETIESSEPSDTFSSKASNSVQNHYETSKKLIENYDKTIELLKDQINIKDDLISTQSRQLENFQVLLKQSSDEILLLESNTTEDLTKQSFFKKVFKKK